MTGPQSDVQLQIEVGGLQVKIKILTTGDGSSPCTDEHNLNLSYITSEVQGLLSSNNIQTEQLGNVKCYLYCSYEFLELEYSRRRVHAPMFSQFLTWAARG